MLLTIVCIDSLSISTIEYWLVNLYVVSEFNLQLHCTCSVLRYELPNWWSKRISVENKKKRKKIWKSTAFFPVMLCIIVLWHNNDLTDSPKFSDAEYTIMCIKTVIKKEGDYWLSATYGACHFSRKTGSFSTTLNSILNRNFNDFISCFLLIEGGKGVTVSSNWLIYCPTRPH